MGIVHSTRNVSFNSWSYQVTQVTYVGHFQEFLEKKITLPGKKKNKFLQISYWEFLFHLIFFQECQFAFQENRHFLIFWKFSRDIFIPFAPILKVSEVLVEWKATFFLFYYSLQRHIQTILRYMTI